MTENPNPPRSEKTLRAAQTDAAARREGENRHEGRDSRGSDTHEALAREAAGQEQSPSPV